MSLGYSKLTPTGPTAVYLASGEGGIPNGAKQAYIQVEGGDIRWRDDNNPPDANDGFLINSGHSFFYDKNLLKFRVIKISGSPIVHVSYY